MSGEIYVVILEGIAVIITWRLFGGTFIRIPAEVTVLEFLKETKEKLLEEFLAEMPWGITRKFSGLHEEILKGILQGLHKGLSGAFTRRNLGIILLGYRRRNSRIYFLRYTVKISIFIHIGKSVMKSQECRNYLWILWTKPSKKFLKSIPGKIPSIKPGETGVNISQSIEYLEELLA